MRSLNLNIDGMSMYYNRLERVPENFNSRHCHDKYEILYVIDGKGKYIVEGVEYDISPRTLMIFPPLTYHHTYVEADTSYERVVLYFGDEHVAECARAALTRLADYACGDGAFYSAGTLSDAAIAVFDRFELIPSLPEAERASFFKLLISELLLLLSATADSERTVDDGELGARVIRYLNENIDKAISLDMLAKRFFVSKYYLCRAFKRHNGISVHGYVNQKRVMHAKQLIEMGETASGAAYRVGFGDYSAFYRAYVKLLGVAPTMTAERSADGISDT